ncbi:hypothetical protein P9272_02540 [Mesorhizobium sp. WSM4976]|uniref:hypothetical protein n=1 Tax=Mesorhizobium sp. WSM4976 TaxID=3038549 RepID=UPI002417D001|nr:hypothetical protein [Mesorhizobium sp. WSM4976]MDG4892475.1 hypothetical protein [Mesorhizobium sp. WSM4976]
MLRQFNALLHRLSRQVQQGRRNDEHRRIDMSGFDQDSNRDVQHEGSLLPMLIGGLVLIVVGMLLVAWLV